VKYLKRFEEVNVDDPKVGDYAIFFDEIGYIDSGVYVHFNEYLYFINNNIGEIIKIENKDNYKYHVKFENVPIDIIRYFDFASDYYYLRFHKEEILYWSKDKKDLEPYIQAKKYNL
jgi:hypothetical protein